MGRASKPGFQQMFLRCPDAVLLLRHGAVALANPAAATLFAAPAPKALEGRAIDGLVHPDFRHTLAERITYLLGGGAPVTMAAERILRFDGEARDVESSSAALGDGAWLLVLRDVTERKKVEAALALTAEQLRALTARQGTLVEEERQRIAREIHDELGQQLTYAKLRLAALRAAAGHAARKHCDEISAAVDASIRTVRRIATELRPAVLDSLGLTAAVEWQVREFQQRCGVAAVFERLEELELPPRVSTALFRILQEALTNVARHSKASEVRVSLYGNDGAAVLAIGDNGAGMKQSRARASQSLGILGMRERAGLLGGTLDIDTAPGAGTRLLITIPLKKRVKNAS